MTKESLLAVIEQLPEEFDLESLIRKLRQLDKIEKGEQEQLFGSVKTHEEVMDYWSKKFAGPKE